MRRLSQRDLQARRDMAFCWASRWLFRRRGGGERRHLRVRTLRKEEEGGAIRIRDALKISRAYSTSTGCPTSTPTSRRIYGSSIHLFSPFYVTHHTRFIVLARILHLKSAILSVHIFLRYHTTFHFAWTRHQVSANIICASISAKSSSVEYPAPL